MRLSSSTLMLWTVAASILAPPELRFGPISLFDGMLLLTLLIGFAGAALRGFPERRLSGVSIVLLGMLALVLVGYVVNLAGRSRLEQQVQLFGMSPEFVYERLSAYGVITLVLLAATYEMAARSFQEERAKLRLLTVIVAAGAVNAVVTLAGWLVATGGVFGRYNFQPLLDGSPGVHAGKMATCGLAALALYLVHDAGRARRRFALACLVLMLASFSTVLVRQAWAFFFLSVLVLVRAGWGRLPWLRWRTLAWAGVAAAVFFVAAAFAYGGQFVLLFRPGGFLTIDMVMRAVLIRQAGEIFLQHPWFGVGYGHFVGYSTVPIFPTESLASQTYVASAHNGMMMVLAEIGVLGAFGFVLLIAALVRDLRRGRAAAARLTEHALVAFVIALFVAAFIGHFTSNSLLLPPPIERSYAQTGFILWVGLGLVAGIARGSRPQPPAAGAPSA